MAHNHRENMESLLRSSTVPISVHETEEATALGHRGILLNRNEILNWNGPVPIQQYRINEDPHPELLTKSSCQPIEYNQDIQVRYLRPPTPPPAGDIIIREQPSTILPAAPPLIIRPPVLEPSVPETLVFREPPPTPPCVPPRKVIIIPGKVVDPPPRKVIIEKLAPLPPKPPAVIIEKWLPYKEAPRRVIFEPAPPPPCPEPVRNLIIQWRSPEACIKKKISYLGVSDADPLAYMAKYGSSLTHSHEYSSLALESPPITPTSSNELVGDIEALRYLDLATLEREGLGMYRHYLTGEHVQKSSITSYEQHQHHSTGHHHHHHHHVHTETHGSRICPICGQTIVTGPRVCPACGLVVHSFNVRV